MIKTYFQEPPANSFYEWDIWLAKQFHNAEPGSTTRSQVVDIVNRFNLGNYKYYSPYLLISMLKDEK